MRLSRRGFLICAAGATAAGLLAACAPGSAGPQPPAIDYGFDVCEQCGMLIGEPRFACAVRLEDGRTLKFDDLGCMVLHSMERPNLKIAAWFVHDHFTEAWTRGETAFYVSSASIASPMGHGLAAFADRKGADAFARSYCAEADCPVLGFDELRAHVHSELH